MIDPIYLKAIIEANKWGAKGWQVIEAKLPHRATEDYKIRLTVMRPIPRLASMTEWFNE